MELFQIINLLSNKLYFLIIFIIYFCLYIFMVIYYRNRRGIKKLFSSVINILRNSNDVKIFISKVNIVFDKYIQKNSYAKKEYTSLQDVIENIIYYSETRNKQVLEKYFGIILSEEEKEKVYSYYNIIKTDLPYDILELYDKDLIINLSKSIKSNDSQSIENVINQLIRELYLKNKKIQKQSKINTMMIITSVVGIILNIIFGILSIKK